MAYNHELFYDEASKTFNVPIPTGAPTWWVNRVTELRNASSDVERRAIGSTPAMPVEYRSAGDHRETRAEIDALAERAWREILAGKFGPVPTFHRTLENRFGDSASRARRMNLITSLLN